jgi:hypothetical protein
VHKGPLSGPYDLDGRAVELITAFLFHAGGDDDPARLPENAGKSFIGSYVLGMGFTFDDTDTKSIAAPLAEMRRLIQKNPRNQAVIFPYIGGEEVNDSPTHAHHRYVIDFFDRNLKEAEEWPDLMSIVRERVKPERDVQNRKALRERWWQYAEKRPGLVAAIGGLERVLSCTLHSKDLSFSFLPAQAVFSHALAVFPLPNHAAFCALQARPHEIWARFFGSSLEDRLRYTPTDCFETFPFPENWETHPALETAGKAYYDFRAALMVRNDEGLTKTYNRFHDPEENDPDILTLRELHAAMDHAVLASYGWADVNTDCKFLLDYEIDEEDWGDKKKPWRYRWPDEVQAEVLARLLELNAERAKEEARAGAPATRKRGRKPGAKRTPSDQDTADLLP